LEFTPGRDDYGNQPFDEHCGSGYKPHATRCSDASDKSDADSSAAASDTGIASAEG